MAAGALVVESRKDFSRALRRIDSGLRARRATFIDDLFGDVILHRSLPKVLPVPSTD